MVTYKQNPRTKGRENISIPPIHGNDCWDGASSLTLGQKGEHHQWSVLLGGRRTVFSRRKALFSTEIKRFTWGFCILNVVSCNKQCAQPQFHSKQGSIYILIVVSQSDLWWKLAHCCEHLVKSALRGARLYQVLNYIIFWRSYLIQK